MPELSQEEKIFIKNYLRKLSFGILGSAAAITSIIYLYQIFVFAKEQIQTQVNIEVEKRISDKIEDEFVKKYDVINTYIDKSLQSILDKKDTLSRSFEDTEFQQKKLFEKIQKTIEKTENYNSELERIDEKSKEIDSKIITIDSFFSEGKTEQIENLIESLKINPNFDSLLSKTLELENLHRLPTVVEDVFIPGKYFGFLSDWTTVEIQNKDGSITKNQGYDLWSPLYQVSEAYKNQPNLEVIARLCVSYSDNGNYHPERHPEGSKGILLKLLNRKDNKEIIYEMGYNPENNLPFMYRTWSGANLFHHRCGHWKEKNTFYECRSSWSATCSVQIKPDKPSVVRIEHIEMEIGVRKI